MKFREHQDSIWKQALSAASQPGDSLLRLTKQRIKDETTMKNTNKSWLRPVAAAALALTILTAGVYAVYQLLTPAQYLEQTGNSVIAAAFKSDQAISVNQRVTTAGHTVTLLGITSGQSLRNIGDDTAALSPDASYAVIAVEKTDGAMPSTSDEAYEDYAPSNLLFSPFIKGEAPWRINIATLNGGTSTYTIDGVMYTLVECDNLDIFADRGVYLGVVPGGLAGLGSALSFDQESGAISANPDAAGICALFELPLDTAKADTVRAQEFLDSIDLYR